MIVRHTLNPVCDHFNFGVSQALHEPYKNYSELKLIKAVGRSWQKILLLTAVQLYKIVLILSKVTSQD